MNAMVQYYYQAKQIVYSRGYYPEVYWQERVNVEHITIQDFLSQHAWVVLSSGMNANVVKKLFVAFSSAFKDWKDPHYIVKNRKSVRMQALRLFAHTGKIDAILFMANYVCANGICQVLNGIKQSGSPFLEQFPFLGPATSKHFAKNIGLNIAKPDRHLIRISKKFGHTTDSLCHEISKVTGDKISVVDIVLWRFATLNRKHLQT